MVMFFCVVAFLFITSVAIYGIYYLEVDRTLRMDYFDFIATCLSDVLLFGEALLSRIVIQKVYHHENRPENYFKEGDEVFFFNVLCGGYLVAEQEPEGVYESTILQRRNHNADGMVGILIGENKYQVDIHSEYLMHVHELCTLKKSILSRWFYCVGMTRADKKALITAIKTTPLQ